MAMFRVLAAFLVSLLGAVTAGSAFASLMVQNAQIAVGGEYTTADRIAGFTEDYQGLVVGTLFQNGMPGSYTLVIAIALAVGFLVAFGMKRLIKPLAPIAYPLAGAAAVALTLALMSMQFYSTTPIAGARGPLGFGLQMLAGAIGGMIFAALRPKR